MATEDYTDVTELPGSGATREQLERLYHRYHTGARYSEGKRVLEAACGSGLGLGFLAMSAASVVGGDYTLDLLRSARSHYRGERPVLRLDAHHLPFRPNSFDLVLIFEAIYYLAEAGKFVQEAGRVLSEGGALLIATVNSDWSDFSPSPHSTRYHSVPELRVLLEGEGFDELEFFGAFPTGGHLLRHRIISIIRRLFVVLRLMPKTLKGRERYKRIFYGDLTPLPHEVSDAMAELPPLEPIGGNAPVDDFKIIYCLACRH